MILKYTKNILSKTSYQFENTSKVQIKERYKIEMGGKYGL